MPEKRTKRKRKSRLQRRLDTIGHIVHLAVQLGLLALLVLLPLARGGRDPWAVVAGLTCVVCLFCLWMINGALRGTLTLFKSRAYWLALAFLGIIGIQLIPFGSNVLGFLPMTVARWDMARDAGLTDLGTSISLAPGGTREALMQLVMVLGAGFLMMNVFCRRSWVIRLFAGIMVMVGVQVVFGFWPALVSTRNWHWYLGVPEHLVHGTFPNRNQFSCMMGMGMVFFLGYLFLLLYSRKHHQRRLFNPDEQSWVKPTIPAIVALIILMMIVGSGQVLSLSRAGATSTALGLCFLGIYGLRKVRHRWHGVALAVGGIAVFLAGASEGLDRLSGRYDKLISVGNMGMVGRVSIWKDCLTLLGDHWLLGTGLGTFELVSPMYETGFVPERISQHAHNDWLELILEFGLPVGLFFSGVVIWFLVSSWRRLLKRNDPLLKWLGITAMTSLTVIALHELVEYNLHIPGTGLAVTAIAIIAIFTTRLPNKEAGAAADVSVIRIGLPKGARVLMGMVCVPGIGLALAIAYPHIVAGRVETTLGMLVSKGVSGSTRMNPEARSRYCLELANRILTVQPWNAFARRQRAEHGTFILQREQERAIAEGRMEAFRKELVSRLETYADDMTVACRNYPTQGDYQAICVAAQEQVGVFRGDISEGQIRLAFGVAHSNYPNLSKVSFMCANGAWRRYARSLQPGRDAADGRGAALALYRKAVEQNPSRAQSVYAKVWQLDPHPQVMRELTPHFLISHEGLYRFFLQKGLFAECLRQLDILAEINATRKTVDDVSELSAYDMGRISRKSRDEVTASLTRRRAFVLGMLGRWGDREAIIADEEALLRLGLAEKLERAGALAESGHYVRADAAYKKLLSSAPGFGKAVVKYAGLLRTSGRYRDCLQQLLTILYRPEIPHDTEVLKKALTLAEQCEMPMGEADNAFAVNRFVRAGLRFLLEKERGNTNALKQVVTELTALAESLRDGTVQRWIQAPMVRYYSGRCQELCESQESAVITYMALLKDYPDHWYTIRRLQHMGIDLPGDTAALYTRISSAIPLKANFGGRVVVLGYDMDSQIIRKGEAVTLRYYCLCIGDIERDYNLRVAFRSQGRFYFSDFIKPGKDHAGEMIGWRVGELVTLERQLNPLGLAARHRKQLNPGLYDLEISIGLTGLAPKHLQPVIPARAPAFKVNGGR